MDHLETEARNPASTNLDELTPLQIVQLMNAEDRRLISAVASQAELIALAITVIAERLGAGGRLVYIGAGTSGRLGVLDATECPPTFNAPPGQVVGLIAGGPRALTQAVEGAEDHPEFAEQDLQAINLSSRDVVVGIASSGRTPYVLGGVAYARRVGAYTVGLSCNPNSELSAAAEVAITPVVGPEALSGSTRLKAGTATKMVLNMLTTGAMVRMGKTYGNLMVDLRATNIKLRARTNRIVRTLTGLSVEAADALLQACGGELKTALVAHLAQVTPEQARDRLERANGQVRRALRLTEERKLAAAAATASPTPSAHRLFLGIDGGGTHTVAILAADDRVLGKGEAGPSNIQSVGPDLAFRGLDDAVTRAFAAAGLARARVHAACFGLAGADRPNDREIIMDWATRVNLAGQVEVTSDAALLLAAGSAEGWGLALIAGTGSIAFGRGPDGRTARAGGWGYLLGDEGSGYALVVNALRAVARAADGRGVRTDLTARFLSRFGVQQPQELIPTIHRGGWDRAALAALAPIVIETADAGDRVADAIARQESSALAGAVMSVVQQLQIDDRPAPLALAGSLLLLSESYRQRVLDALPSCDVKVSAVTMVHEPALGAVAIARR